MRTVLLLAAVAGLAPAPRATNEQPAEQLRQTESAFARTMADRDHAAFMSFLADETVFIWTRGRWA
jgi:hypothetical protein